LPIRLIEEANPDWRLIGWILALVVVCFTLLTIDEAAGVRWLRHFAFPVCFPLVAVPWPAQFENFVVQFLTRGVEWAAVEISGWIGVGAYQLGNVIELHNGFVGVDEACSGIKTLQAGIMVALALGEFFRLTKSRRIFLVVAGCAWVFVCNVLRATALVAIASRSGFEELARLHDPIGTAALLAGMAGLVGLALVWRSRVQVIAPSGAKPLPTARSWHTSAAGVAWLIVAFALTETWYRVHERSLIARPSWTARWPDDEGAIKRLVVPEATRSILHYDSASSAEWRDTNGVRWWGFFARWEPSRTSLQLVRSHSPDICLPAAGRTFTRTLPPVAVRNGDIELQFASYEFTQQDQPLFVFVSIEEDKRAQAGTTELAWNTAGRLQAVMLGRRNLGQRLLELAVVGVDDFARAREALQRTATAIID